MGVPGLIVLTMGIELPATKPPWPFPLTTVIQLTGPGNPDLSACVSKE